MKDFEERFQKIKEEFFGEELSKASKKQLLQQLGQDPEAPTIASWLSQNAPRDDVQQWFLRNYKKDPKAWNDNTKSTIQHYMGMAETDPNGVGKVRFDKSHSLEDGINRWKQAEGKLQQEIAKNPRLVEPDASTKKMIDLGDGWGWYDLGKSFDPVEGNAMGHCGNADGKDRTTDRVLSLRKEKKVGGKTYHEPHLTFINNGGYIGESKGRANNKPDSKYHEAIAELMRHPGIKENIGGGWDPGRNFYINDLPPEMREKLLREKPNIERLFTQRAGRVDPNEYPEHHREQAHNHNHGLAEINSGHYGLDAAMFRDADPQKAKAAIHKVLADAPYIRGDEYNDEFYDPNHEKDALKMMKSPHLDANHIEAAWDNPHLRSLLSSPAATPEIIDKALDHENVEIRYAAVNSPHFGPQHMDKALGDKDLNVRIAAVQSPHFGPQHMDKAMNDEYSSVHEAAVKSPHFGPQHMDKALGDECRYTRIAAVQSPHFGPQHMDKALGDNEEWVRDAAKLRQQEFKEKGLIKKLEEVATLLKALKGSAM